MKANWVSLLVVASLMSPFLRERGFAQQKEPEAEQPLTLCDDQANEQTVAPPKSVAAAILQTREARKALATATKEQKSETSRLLRAVEVRLGNPGETDYVVIGQFPLNEADAGWFWIARYVRRQPAVVLFVAANCIELKTSRSHGLRDVASHFASARARFETQFQFDGTAYRRKVSTVER